MVGLRLVGDEAVFLDQLAGEFSETIAFAVTVKDQAEDAAQIGTAVSGRAARPVQDADVHHAAHEHGK